jgi:hypothetical protein
LNKQRMMMLASSSSTLGCKKKQRGDAFFTEPAVARCTSFGGRGLVPSRSSCTHYICCADNQRVKIFCPKIVVNCGVCLSQKGSFVLRVVW